MKKIIIALLCCAMLTSTSCNKNNDIELNNNTSHGKLTDNTITDTDNANNIDYNSNQDTINDFSKLNGSMSTNEYETIINMYKGIVNIHKLYNPNESYEKHSDNFSQKWYREIFNATLIGNVSNNSYGYAYSDLNSDDKSELILLLEDYTIIAIFSMVDGTPMLLDTFSANNHYVALDQDGILYQTGYGKGENSYTKIMQLSDSGNFETLLEFGCCDNGMDFEYYVIENSVKRIVDLQSITSFQQQYDSLLQNPSNTNKNSGILYIPVM